MTESMHDRVPPSTYGKGAALLAHAIAQDEASIWSLIESADDLPALTAALAWAARQVIAETSLPRVDAPPIYPLEVPLAHARSLATDLASYVADCGDDWQLEEKA